MIHDFQKNILSKISELNEICECLSFSEGIEFFDKLSPITENETNLFDPENIVLCAQDANISPSTKIRVRGNNNILLILAEANINGSEIEINGSGNFLIFGPKSTTRLSNYSVSGNNSVAIIGESTSWVGRGQLICDSGKHILIGKDCMLAHGLVIRTSDGHGIFDRTTHKRINHSKSVLIHPHVWLANSVRVNKGSEIGTGTVVAQNSIVTRKLGKNCLYGGTPASLIKKNIVWSRTEEYQNIPDVHR